MRCRLTRLQLGVEADFLRRGGTFPVRRMVAPLGFAIRLTVLPVPITFAVLSAPLFFLRFLLETLSLLFRSFQ